MLLGMPCLSFTGSAYPKELDIFWLKIEHLFEVNEDSIKCKNIDALIGPCITEASFA